MSPQKIHASDKRRLLDDTEPAQSPDGKSLAFTQQPQQARSRPQLQFRHLDRPRQRRPLCRASTDKGAHLTKITINPGTDRQPAWSPDGKWIAYSQPNRRPKPSIYATHHVAIAPPPAAKQKSFTLVLDRSVRRRVSSATAAPFISLRTTGTESPAAFAIAGR
jgi:dipeptidyl aminopeptidase/acylaminoacyl peptidase